MLWLAGLLTEQADAPSAEQNLKDFEQALLSNAVQLARTGHLNSKSAPGLNRATTVLAAQRSSAIPGGADRSMAGIGDIGITPGEAIRMTQNGITNDSKFEVLASLEDAIAANKRMGSA